MGFGIGDLMDDLRDYLANTPEEKAYAKGFHDGRKHVLKIQAWFLVYALGLTGVIVGTLALP